MEFVCTPTKIRSCSKKHAGISRSLPSDSRTICQRRSRVVVLELGSARLKVMTVWTAATVAAMALGCSGTQARQTGCSKDTDCKDPRVCEKGVCVDPQPVGQSLALPKEATSASPVKGPPAF